MSTPKHVIVDAAAQQLEDDLEALATTHRQIMDRLLRRRSMLQGQLRATERQIELAERFGPAGGAADMREFAGDQADRKRVQ